MESVIISGENKEKKPIKFCPECGSLNFYYDKKCKCGHEFEDVEERPQPKGVINPFYFYEYFSHGYDEDDFEYYEEWYRESEGMNCRDDDSWDYGNV